MPFTDERCISKPLQGARLNRTHPLARGLVGYWLFNEVGSSFTNDLTGNHAKGALPNGAVWTSGLLGPMLELSSASSQYVDFGQPPRLAFSSATPFSIRCRLSTTSPKASIFGKQGSAPYSGYSLEIDSGGIIKWQLINNYSNNLASVQTSAAINDGREHEITATYDGSSSAAGLRVYLDGAQQTSTVNSDTLTGSIGTTTGVLCGSFDNGAGNFLSAAIAFLEVYNRALPAQEIAWKHRWPFGMMARPGPFIAFAPPARAGAPKFLLEQLGYASLSPLTGIH